MKSERKGGIKSGIVVRNVDKRGSNTDIVESRSSSARWNKDL